MIKKLLALCALTLVSPLAAGSNPSKLSSSVVQTKLAPLNIGEDFWNIVRCATSADGNYIAVQLDYSVVFYSLNDGNGVCTYAVSESEPGYKVRIEAIALSSDGKYLAIVENHLSAKKTHVSIMSTESKKTVLEFWPNLSKTDDAKYDCVFSEDDTQLLLATHNPFDTSLHLGKISLAMFGASSGALIKKCELLYEAPQNLSLWSWKNNEVLCIKSSENAAQRSWQFWGWNLRYAQPLEASGTAHDALFAQLSLAVDSCVAGPCPLPDGRALVFLDDEDAKYTPVALSLN